MITGIDPVQSLVREVLADARKSAQQTLDRAYKNVDRAMVRAKDVLAKERERHLERAALKAQEETQRIEERLKLERQKERVRSRALFMERILERAILELREQQGQDSDLLMDLVAEAIGFMSEEDLSVHVPPFHAERIASEGQARWTEEVLRRADKKATLEWKGEPKVLSGAQIVSRRGHLRYNNSLEARLLRRRESLLAELDQLMDREDMD